MKIAYLILSILMCSKAFACIGKIPTVVEAFEHCDALIFGRVTQLTLEDDGRLSAIVRVEHQLKGEKEEEHVIYQIWGDSCMFEFRIGRKYLIYCHENSGSFYTDMSTGTKEFSIWREPSDEYIERMKLSGIKIKEPTEEQVFINELIAKQGNSNQSR